MGFVELIVRPVWLAIAVTSVILLGFLAPSGLALLGFLGVIILTHEAGHLLAARRSGMKPTEFFWGFGPEILAFESNGCRYGLKALWLGGYVRLEGMTPSSELPEGFDEAGTYRAASHRGRLLTILAGPVVNLISAVVAFSAAAMTEGFGIFDAVALGFGDTWFVITATAEALWVWGTNAGDYLAALFDGSGSTAPPVRFMSPVAQASVSGQALDLGLGATLQWFGILACAIGAINLLPLPPLDGSHAVMVVGERLAQRFGRNPAVRFDVARLLPLAYATIGLLVLLSLSALVLDLRDLA